MSRVRFETLALTMFLLVLCTPLAMAQATTASLVGTVNDSSGAVVSQAKIEAKAVATTQIREITTDGEGNYILTNLPVGQY